MVPVFGKETIMWSHELTVTENAIERVRSDLSTVLFPIEMAITEQLYSLCVEGCSPNADQKWQRNTYWTRRVKECLKELGEKQGLLVFPELKTGKFEGQWLFDLVWVDAKPDDSKKGLDWKGTRGLKLACECEWTSKEEHVLEDFLKLTFAIADIRLFIYTNRHINIGHDEVHPTTLCKRVSPLSRGFRYLTLGFPESARGMFRIDSWIA